MIRRLGTLAIVVGIGVLAWTTTVYLWKDPFTAAYTAFEQRRLESRLQQEFATWEPRVVTAAPPRQAPAKARTRPVDVPGEAVRYREAKREGDPFARLTIPRIDLNVVVVNGTDTASLRTGPGRHLESAMPGEGELVYIAGHRTTFGAPFSAIDEIRPGDRVLLEVPYATFEYRMSAHRIVDQYELSVLESRGREEIALQACHPRFFASQRYIVYAKLVHVVPKRVRVERKSR